MPPETFANSIRDLLPRRQVGGLLEEHAHYRRDEAAIVSPMVAEITGTPRRGIEQFAPDGAQHLAVQAPHS